jgi:hypothetical protein
MSPEEEGMEEAVEHDDVFVECVPTNDDVFVFLSSLDRSETSVSSSVASSSSSESLRCFSNCPNDKLNHDDGEDDDGEDDDEDAATAYMDTTTNHSSEDHDNIEQYDFGVDDDVDIGLDVSSSSVEDQESICSLSCSSFEKDNEEEEEEDVDTLRRLELPPLEDAVAATAESPQSNGGNPIGFAVHVVQNIWQGSKKTPVGFAVNLTEGIFRHLVGMIHSDNREPEANKPPMEDTKPDDDKLFRIEDFEIMRPNIESAMIAEPDPLDAAEFVLEGTNNNRDTSTTSAILLDSELENTDSIACDVSMSMDLFRRLDISINMESSSPQRKDVSDGTMIAFH